jgi:hypothetical protein
MMYVHSIVVVLSVTFLKKKTWTSDQIAVGLQDFLICIEMFIISLLHTWVFGYEPYRIKDKTPFIRVSFTDVCVLVALGINTRKN